MRSGLERAQLLKSGSGHAELVAGLAVRGGDFDAFVEGRVGWRPTEALSVFGFGRADLVGMMAGVGLSGHF